MSEIPSHFVAVCPNCLVALKVRLAYSGSYVRCRHCEHKFRAFRPDHLLTPRSEEYQSGPLSASVSEAGRIDVSCPSCSTSLSVSSELAGQRIQCKQCNERFLVPKIEGLPGHVPDQGVEPHVVGKLEAPPQQSRPAHAEAAATEQPPEPSAELGALREENENLRVKLESFQQEHAAIQSEKQSLLAQFEQLGGELERLRSEQEPERQAHQLLRDELASLRGALGGLSPDEVAALCRERQSLSDENQRLRDQLSSEQVQRDELSDHVAQHAQALDALRRQSDELTEKLRQRDDELATKLAELERMATLRQADETEALELRATLARREQELAQDCQALRGQIDEVHETLLRTRQAHGDEKSQLDEQHQAARVELEATRLELDTARSEIGSLGARLSVLQDQQDKIKADHREEVEAQRAKLEAEYQTELEADRARHAHLVADLETQARANADLIERLKAEILTMAQSRSVPDADLAAAREEIADLRAKLADTEITRRSMSSLLEGMGIHLH